MNIDSQSQCEIHDEYTTTAASMNSSGGESQSNQGLYIQNGIHALQGSASGLNTVILKA